MIETGCLKQPDVSSIYGLHVKPEIEAGKSELNMVGYMHLPLPFI